MNFKKTVLIFISLATVFLFVSCFSEKKEESGIKLVLKWVMPGP